MKKRSNNLYLAGAILVIGMLIALTVMGGATQAQSGVQAPVNYEGGEVQNVKLTMSGYTYTMTPSTVKQGVLVRMEADLSTMRGCMRSISIPAFGVRKVVSESDNVIEFVPTKAGTFNIACSMNMGKGSFTVVAQDGSKSDYVEQAPVATGGCGCGGGGAGSCH